MNTLRKPSLVIRILECVLLACSAGLLLRATWLPVIEVKGFDTFALESMALWATRAARVTLIASLVCLPIRPLGIARWWMALSIGILFSHLADMGVQAADMAKMMPGGGSIDIMKVIVLRTGTWFCAAGLACWLLDLLVALGGLIRGWCRRRVPRVLADPPGSAFQDPLE